MKRMRRLGLRCGWNLMDVAAHRLAGKWYNMHLNMSGEMHMLRRAHAVMMRYSAAYPTGAERIVKVTSLGPMGSDPIVKNGEEA